MTTVAHMHAVLLFASISTINSLYSWVQQTSPLMPTPSCCAVTGYDSTNSRIWIIGGGISPYKSNILIEYNTEHDNFTMSTVSGISIGSFGQSYTQIDDILYLITDTVLQTELAIFNVNTKQFIYPYNNIIFPVNVGSFACMTALNNQYLLITGGRTPNSTVLTTFFIYDINNNAITSGPDTPHPVAWHTCQVGGVSNSWLYVIGGATGTGRLKEAIKIFVGEIDTINQYRWSYLNPELLSEFKSGVRSIKIASDIYVIGGWQTSRDPVHVDIINTLTDQIKQDGYLASSVFHSAVIIANQRIYAFGGVTETTAVPLQTWQYALLPTPNPTDIPSQRATLYPTYIPSTFREETSVESTAVNGTEEIGINIECDSFSKLNRLRTDCDFVAPWWLYLLCSICVFSPCIVGGIYKKLKRKYVSDRVHSAHINHKKLKPNIDEENNEEIEIDDVVLSGHATKGHIDDNEKEGVIAVNDTVYL